MSELLVKVSDKNSKIGNIANLSLPPGSTCVPGIPCYDEGCYALQCYKMFPNVRTAWQYNLSNYRLYPILFFEHLEEWLQENNPIRFRLFVGGDFPDEVFFKMFNDGVWKFPQTNFLVFTKRYDYDYTVAAPNFKIILSCWPGVPLPENTDLPRAYLKEDERRPKDSYVMCPGKCFECNHKCWDMVDSFFPVVFPKHR